MSSVLVRRLAAGNSHATECVDLSGARVDSACSMAIRAVLTLDRFVALDVEIACRSPIRVCAIGVARFESGREVDAYRSFVHAEGTIRYSRIHGLTRSELISAPSWPKVWKETCALIGDVRTIVAYRARFDRGAILTMSARHNIRLPALRFVCAAQMVAGQYGRAGSLAESIKALGLSFPGQPHEPLADARAAAMVALACIASRTT